MCRRDCTLGLIYCLDCWEPLPGRTERNIFATGNMWPLSASNSDAGGDSDADHSDHPWIATRNGDEEIAKIISDASVYVETVSGKKRGYTRRSDF